MAIFWNFHHMSNLFLAFSVVFPLFFMMSLGYLLKLTHVLNERFLKELNQFCFRIFLPFILFDNIYKSNFHAVFSLKLVVFAIISTLALFLILLFIIPLFERSDQKRSVIIQGIFRSNFILFGIPITTSLYGGQNVATTALLIAFLIPLFNLLSVVVLHHFSKRKIKPIIILKNIITNPLIIASIVGFCFVLTGIRLPVLVATSVSSIAQVATPLALITLGGSFQFRALTRSIFPLVWTVIGKLMILPLIFIPLSIVFGFKHVELTALVALFASPTAVSTYTMAQQADADDTLAGQIVVLSSLLSILSLFLIITILKALTFI